MLIVNKEFHDYYDTAMVYGIDKTIVYDRKRKEINFKDKKRWFFSTQCVERGDQAYYLYPKLLGFCGEFIPLIRCEKHSDGVQELFFYSIDDFKTFLKTDGIEIRKSSVKALASFYKSILEKKHLDEFYNKNTWEWSELFFHKYNTPIFLIENVRRYSVEGRLIINPCLKEMGFMKEVSAPEAFQKIEMFISGVLGKTEIDNNIEVDEKTKLGQKGFDKWTFKKLPTKKR